MTGGELTPKEIVAELDRYIIGQDAAKRAVAIALRNRLRRQQLSDELRDEVIPKNILMIGPTGVGKTEIARRLAHLANAPFMKVEATKYTEVGYVGRDVESMIRDLVETAIRMVEQERFEEVQEQAEEAAERRLVDLLVKGRQADVQRAAPTPDLLGMLRGEPPAPAPPETEVERETREARRRQEEANRRLTERRLQAGELENEIVTIEVDESPHRTFQIWSQTGLEEMGVNLQDMLGSMFPSKRTHKQTTVSEARRIFTMEEADKLVDPNEVSRVAIERVEDSGIIFLDELDKVAGREGGHGPDVSREGVQRDILPIVEGCTVMTKYGPCATDHILFIAAGAFHVSRPSDLIPELQGRFPLRVELKSLSEDDFRRILVEPRNSLVKQYTALLATEDVRIDFTDDA
ncbi:MAG: ATP-dependent protease ATPase subunit HslU, partial [Armatimonadetes bacterium]|nr:ATP-dependent protease ATPase subunit HslU [Armatimonadota bacterium]